ncbi:Hsp20 family protein [Lyngbya aestuarii]|uniref:Hsp20 family protein n=1 Tax=Lyngbya aestuarii TaxID=118322 RepID=UPI00403DB060
MTLMNWQPLSELEYLRSQIYRLLSEMISGEDSLSLTTSALEGFLSPPIELEETDKEMILRAEIPGLQSQEVEVEVCQESISIAGEHRHKKPIEPQDLLCTELHYGKFKRVIPLPVLVQEDQVEAEVRDGILTVTMPKI